jgi:hypothetical protein
MIQAIIFITGILAGTSLVFGLALAVAVLIWTHDVAAAVRLIGNGYYALVGVMPIALWLALFTSYNHVEYASGYTTPLRALSTTLQGALLGSVLGAGPIFMAAVIYVPGFFGDFEIAQLGSAVRDVVIWSRLALAAAAAIIPAIPLGLWAHYTRTEQRDE